ncbi:pyrroline-5-carboxylate reductase [Pelagibacterium halotolerans B2]|uniref:Pyrroline-5-carboxylate reductase n=2 Tax=Pelagibacterium TaxID=1082930 RepID=G4R6F7_PELHB|nr:pyrroline-5-carboxylate reductase [Pelagibacterium halotolerans B2]
MMGKALYLVGAGNMGIALLERWLETGTVSHEIIVIDPTPSAHLLALQARYGFELNPERRPVADIVVIAVKPQYAKPAAARLADICNTDTLVISIMAGLLFRSLTQLVPSVMAFVRAMPNLAARHGKGLTALAASLTCSDAERKAAEALFAAAGSTVWVDEEDFDVATAIGGSGPGYLLLFVECMAQAAQRTGLEPEAAEALAEAVVIGTAALLENEKQSPADIRRAITSPGGTTQAGLNVLMEHKLDGLVARTIEAAAQRSRDLQAELSMEG